MDPDYATCSEGQEQSPVDIASATSDPSLDDLSLNYHDTPLIVMNNGHTAEIEYEEGSTLTFEGETYELVQFHFHAPTEHSFDGSELGLEMHMVHKDEAGNLAVIGLLMEEGAENAFLASFWDEIPAEEGEVELSGNINAADALPSYLSYYTYPGSLTTPPCTEGVRWIVLDGTQEASAEQIDHFISIFGHNARPTQPLNDRSILYYEAR